MNSGGYIEEFEQELPAVQADFKHWGSMPYWTLDECVALLLKQDPIYVNWDIAKDYQEWPYTTHLSVNYAKLRILILRAYENQEITDPIAPTIFLPWAESRDLEIPPELKEQVKIIARNQFLLDEETQAILKKKDDEIAVLRKQIANLKSLVWDGFDENQSTYSKELAIAVKAHSAISKEWKKGSSIKQQITQWLETHYPKLMNEEKERIAKICNWQKSGGAPSTP